MGTRFFLCLLIIINTTSAMKFVRSGDLNSFIQDPFSAQALGLKLKKYQPKFIKELYKAMPILTSFAHDYVTRSIDNTCVFNNVAVSAKGDLVATYDSEKNIKLWCAYTAQLLSTWHKREKNITAMYFNPEGNALLINTTEGLLECLSISNGNVIKSYILNAPNAGLFWLHDGTFLTTQSAQRIFKVWSLAASEPIKEFTSPGSCIIDVLFVNHAGSHCAIGHTLVDCYAVSVIDLRDNKTKRFTTLPYDVRAVFKSLQISKLQKYLAAGTSDGDVCIWNMDVNRDLGSQEKPIFFLQGIGNRPLDFSFNEQESLCAIVYLTGLIKICSYAGNKAPVMHETLDKQFTYLLHQDGQFIAVSDSEHRRFMWHLAKATMLKELEKKAQAQLIVSNPKATILAFVHGRMIDILHLPKKELIKAINELSVPELLTLIILKKNPKIDLTKTTISAFYNNCPDIIKTIIQRSRTAAICDTTEQKLLTSDGKELYLSALQAQECGIFRESIKDCSINTEQTVCVIPAIVDTDRAILLKILTLLSVGCREKLIKMIGKKPLEALYRVYHLGRFFDIPIVHHEALDVYRKIQSNLSLLQSESNKKIFENGLPKAAPEFCDGDELVRHMDNTNPEKKIFDPITYEIAKELTETHSNVFDRELILHEKNCEQLITYLHIVGNLHLNELWIAGWTKYFLKTMLDRSMSSQKIIGQLAQFNREALVAVYNMLQNVTLSLANAPNYQVKTKKVAITHHQNKSLAFFSNEDGLVYCWNPNNPQYFCLLYKNELGSCNLAINNAGNKLALGEQHVNAKLVVLDLDAWDFMTIKAHKSNITSLAFRHDDALLATASHDTLVKLWRVVPLQLFLKLKGHREKVDQVCFHTINSLLASASAKQVFIWDSKNGQCLRKIEQLIFVVHIDFTPTGEDLLIGIDLGLIYAFNLKKAALNLIKSCMGDLVTFAFMTQSDSQRACLVVASRIGSLSEIDLFESYDRAFGKIKLNKVIKCIYSIGKCLVLKSDAGLDVYNTDCLERRRGEFLKLLKDVITTKNKPS